MAVATTRGRVATVLSGVALLWGSAQAAVFLVIAARRVAFPFELEWLEGVGLDHIARIAAGQPFYPAPSVDFLPLIYTPLYFHIAALPSLEWPLVGAAAPAFWFGRALSALATIVAAAAIGALVRRAGGRTLPAMLAATTWLGAFEVCGRWFDLMKADTPMMALVLGGTWALDAARGDDIRRRGATAMLAAALFVAAIFVKQSAVFYALAAGVFVIWRRRELLLPFAATGVGLSLIGLAVCHIAWGEWFWYYVVNVPAAQPVAWPRVPTFFTADLLAVVGPLILLAALRLVAPTDDESTPARDTRRLLLALTVAGFVAAFLGRVHWGGWINNRIYLVAPLIAYAFAAAAPFFPRLRFLDPQGGDAPSLNALPRLAATLPTLAAILVLTQFALFAYDPRDAVPTAKDREKLERVVARISAVDGDVWIPDHGGLARQAGKRPFAHAYVMRYLENAEGPDNAVTARMESLIEQRAFGAVVVGYNNRWQEKIDAHYRFSARLLPRTGFGRFMTGTGPLPRYLMTPRGGAE
ncbi:MAG: hypothetical protein H6683_09280 [Deltaproteobacteria bacterium]|nr:hypothetical protein [Deltaproteobacteria bacterium]